MNKRLPAPAGVLIRQIDKSLFTRSTVVQIIELDCIGEYRDIRRNRQRVNPRFRAAVFGFLQENGVIPKGFWAIFVDENADYVSVSRERLQMLEHMARLIGWPVFSREVEDQFFVHQVY